MCIILNDLHMYTEFHCLGITTEYLIYPVSDINFVPL